MDVSWQVISGDSAFFEVTKGIHNGLQGGPYQLTPATEEQHLLNSTRNAQLLDEHFDIIVIHDPQPAAIAQLHKQDDALWIWRCHIDTAQANPKVAAFLIPFLSAYDAAIFTMADFVLPSLSIPIVRLIPPGIVPLSPKNLDLPGSVIRSTIEWMGVDPDRPLMIQVSRFDPWKDPLGVVQIYRLLRASYPTLQLALLGSMALDDPEGWRLYERILAETRDDPGVLVATNITGVSNIEVNAFQRHATVAIQKSLREGFGLVVSETLWKGTPVVAGAAGGIRLQMPVGTGGFLVDSYDEQAFVARIGLLLEQPDERQRLGSSGHAIVQQHFLITRMVADELELWLELNEKRQRDG